MKKIALLSAAAATLLLSLSSCNTHIHTKEKSAGAPQAVTPDLLAIDPEALADAKIRYEQGDEVMAFAADALVRLANRSLNQGPFSVTTKALTADSGNKQDYISIGPYWWPDSNKPDGLPWIRRDGERNPATSGPDTDKLGFNSMFYAVSALALGHFYTSDERYLSHADTLIYTWFVNPETRMNPNLNYGQAVPGKVSGREFGIIESRFLIRLLDDIRLLNRDGALNPNTVSGFEGWLSAYLDWLLTSDFGKRACDAHNNHGTYCEAQIASYAWFLGRNDIAKAYVERTKYHRLNKQITALGEQPDELERTRPWHYSLFNLEAYFVLAEIGERLGVDLWHYESEDGGSVKKALDYIVAFTETGKDNWHNRKIKSSVRSGRVFNFMQRAAKIYNDESYISRMAALPDIVANEDRSELVQCLLIGPYSDAITLSTLKKMDPDGSKSLHRCYY